MWRCVITAPRKQAPADDFVEGYVAEDELLIMAREQAYEVGLRPVSRASGAALRVLAAASQARAVVEIGTGTGVSGLWLLRGMRPDGVLTTIDIEAEHQRVARRVFAGAGLAPSRTRIIAGRALDVLPRLSDDAYDLVFVHHDPIEYTAALIEAARLLRVGGMLVIGDALGGGRIADPTARDPETVAVREAVRTVREADEWLPAVIPTVDGLVCAVKRSSS
jgi:predicted O-methyltransferase YrrM